MRLMNALIILDWIKKADLDFLQLNSPNEMTQLIKHNNQYIN